MRDLVLLKKPDVFVPETPSRMMTFLAANVINNPTIPGELREGTRGLPVRSATTLVIVTVFPPAR